MVDYCSLKKFYIINPKRVWCCWDKRTCGKHQRYWKKYRHKQQNEDENKGRK